MRNDAAAVNFSKGYLVESLKEQGAAGFDEDEIKQAARPLLDAVFAYLANNLNDLATLVENKDCLFPAHYPELCLAWMQSMDENYTTDAGQAFSSGSYRIIRINCPVDVNVYDAQGELVASIAGNEAQQLDASSINAMINSDGEKVVYLPADAQFTISITGREAGAVTYSVNEYSYEAGQVNRLVNYYDVPIEKDRSLHATVPAYASSYLNNGTAQGTDTAYGLTDMDGNALKPDADMAGDDALVYYTVTAASDNPEQGAVTGSGVRQVGNYAQVTAIAKDGYHFDGWYMGEQKVSADAAYRFCVTEDVTVTAKFTGSTPVAAGNTDTPASSDGAVWIILAVVFMLLLTGGLIFFVVFSAKKAPGGLDIPVIAEPSAAVSAERVYQRTEDVARTSGIIQVTNGSMNGFTVPIHDGETLYLGTDKKVASIAFTGDYKNVSRLHCSVTFDAKANRYYVVDCSSNGTYLMGNRRLTKGKRTPVDVNTILLLANENCTVLLG